jgi:hypothetical protein
MLPGTAARDEAADEATSPPSNTLVRVCHQHALSINNAQMVVELLAVADQNALCMFHVLLLDVW